MVNRDQHTANMLTFMLVPGYERYILFYLTESEGVIGNGPVYHSTHDTTL